MTSILLGVLLGLSNPAGLSGTNVSGNISVDTTWTLAGSPYCLTGTTTVLPGVTLTIDPGVEVQIPNRFHELSIEGTLLAVGTNGNLIRFLGPSPSTPGGSVAFRLGSSGTVRFADLQSLGGSGSAGGAIAVVGTDAVPIITDCQFSDNVRDVVGHEAAFTQVARNQALYSVRDATVGGNYTWPAGQYTVDGTVTIDASASLTVDAGVELLLFERFRELFIDGSIDVQGVAANPVLVRGRDSSNLGSRIVIRSGATQATFRHTEFEFLGNVYEGGAIYIPSPTSFDPVIEQCRFSNNIKDVLAHEGAFTACADNEALYSIRDATVGGNYTWPVGQYALDGTVTIDASASLTVDAGVELLLFERFRELFIDGSVDVQGDASNPVLVRGGDSSSLGSRIVILSGASQVSFRHTEFEFLGNVYEGGAIYIPSPTTDDPVIEQCRFTANLGGKDILGHEGAFTACADNEAIYWVRDSVVNQPFAWPKGTYRLERTTTIDSGATLVIEAGAHIELYDRFSDLSVEGILDANGTEDAPVVFRGVSSASRGASVVVQSASPSVTLDYTEFYDLGNGSFSSALCDAAGTVSMNDCVFARNPEAYRVVAGSPRLRCTHFVANSLAVNNTGTGIVDAKKCWWGVASGPGASVQGSVETDPFLPLPCLFVLEATPEVVEPMEVANIVVRLCNPNEFVVLYAVALNGVPISPIPLGRGRAGSSGEWGLGGPIPPGTSGLTVDLLAYSLGADGVLRVTPVETLTVN